eukprot:49885_1
MIGHSLATRSGVRAGKRSYPAFRQSLRLFSTPSGQRGNSAVNGKGLKSNGVGEVSSIKAAEKEVKKSRRYLLLLGAAGGGAALVYLKPKAIFDTLETLPIYSTLGFKSRATDETTTAAVDAQLQSKPTTALYNEDPEGTAVREAAATDSDETPSTVEEDTRSSFVTTSEESSTSTSSKPEEASPTENELYSTSEKSSSTFNPKPEKESPTENELYSTSQSEPKSSGDPMGVEKPDDDVRQEVTTTSLQEEKGGAPETGKTTLDSETKAAMKPQDTTFCQGLEMGMLRDLEKLDAPALRYRIAQLVVEMQERTKWESLRWHETMKRLESDMADHYGSLTALQKESLLAEKEEALAKERALHDKLFEEALSQRAEELKAVLNEEFIKQLQAKQYQVMTQYERAYEDKLAEKSQEMSKVMADEVEKIEQRVAYESESRREEIKSILSRLETLQRVVDSQGEADSESSNVHAIAAATLGLCERLDSRQSAGKEIEALNRIGEKDELLKSILRSIPKERATSGCPTTYELTQRFNQVRNEGRRAAFVPENNTGLLGQTTGLILSWLAIPRKGLVEGETAEVLLARAQFRVDRGDLQAAIGELSALKGLPRVTVSDWVEDAKSRLALDQTVRVLRAHSALLSSNQSQRSVR